MKIFVRRCPTFGNIAPGILDVLRGMCLEADERSIIPAPEDSICNVGAAGDGGYMVSGEEMFKVLHDDVEADDLMWALARRFGQWRKRMFIFHFDDVATLPLLPPT